MLLKKARVENFRNIKHAELEFSPQVNIFHGDNAQGKTNLLEAISVALGKSFRNIRKNDIIPFNYTNGITNVTLFYESEQVPGNLNNIAYRTTQEKCTVEINSIPLKKATDLYGEFKYVVFIPDNLHLIKGYPDMRRYYLDNIAIMQNKSHRRFLSEYKEALKQRCAACISGNYRGNMMEVWDDILVKQGINLTYGRLKYLNLIKSYATDIYSGLSGGEQLGLSYYSDVFGGMSGASEMDFSNKANLYGVYKRTLREVHCGGHSGKTPGAHRDDVVFTINGKNARTYGSQGQLRSIAVSLKLAEAAIIRDFNRENPVVLLDEVLGELDGSRRQYVVKHFDNSQVFITSCNINDFEKMDGLKVWSVKNGVFTSGQ